MARVLLFNLPEDRAKRVRALLFRLKLTWREVRPEEQGQTVDRLLRAGKDDPGETAGEASAFEPFSQEMLVMAGLTAAQFHLLLDGLRAQGIRIPLKAVATETNVRWPAVRLYEELKCEAEAMAGGRQPAHAQPQESESRE